MRRSKSAAEVLFVGLVQSVGQTVTVWLMGWLMAVVVAFAINSPQTGAIAYAPVSFVKVVIQILMEVL